MKSRKLTREFEFNSIQNELLWKVSYKMRNIAYFWMAMGVLALIAGLVDIVINGKNIIQLVVNIFLAERPLETEQTIRFVFSVFILAPYIIFIGKNTVKAAGKLRRIVNTDGSDVSYLLSALQKLERVCSLHYQLAVLLVAAMWINIIFN